MPRLPLLLLSLLAVNLAGAEGAARLVDNMEDPALYRPAQPELKHQWTGRASLETADFKEGKGCLRFDIDSAKSDGESYPQWGRSFDPAREDWSGYKALRYWVKVQSRDPAVPYKNMCVVVYNGDSPLQQFVVHQVPVGKWVQLTDQIVDYNRDRVRGIIIYMYETNPRWQDSYTWRVDGLELLPAPEGAIGFDGVAIQPRPEPTRPTRHEVSGRRLKLGLDDRGRVTGFACDKRSLYRAGKAAHPYTGLLVRDWRRGEQIVPVSGGLRTSGSAVVQETSLLQGLKIRAVFRNAGPPGPVGRDWLSGEVTIRDTKPADRPLTLYFALPVEAKGWTWWDDICTPRAIDGPREYLSNPSNMRVPRISPYPYCCINDQDTGLALATPLDVPRLQRMVYSPALGVLYLAYHFCLTPAATKQQQRASFRFHFAPVDPAWGFRAMATDYYRAFPQFFTKRVPKEGGWGCWGSYADNPHIPELGYMFHWGPNPRGSAADHAAPVKYDNEHGYLSLPYIEWTNMHVSMETYEKAGPEDIMAQVRYIADPQRKEPLPRYRYCFPYDERMGPDYDGSMRAVFQAYLKSLIFSPEGLIYGGADRAEFGLLAGKYIPFNADPDIPGGAGDFFLNRWWPTIEQYYRERGARMDGFGWDNFYVRGTSLDYRREHLAYANHPPAFDPQSLEPAIAKDMSTYELQQAVVEKLRRLGRILIANQGTVSAVPATLPLLDVFGYEWNVGNAGTYARTLAYHKPVCSLPCDAAHYRDPYVRDHLLYGNWPGGYHNTDNEAYLALMRRTVPIVRRQTQAGWEPVTLARCDDPRVQVERFGGQSGRPLLFSLKNGGAKDSPVRLTLDPALKPSGPPRELVEGLPCATKAVDGVTQVKVLAPAGQVIVIAF